MINLFIVLLDYVQRNIPYAEGRVGSVDMCHFIHAIVPRHVECIVLMSKKKE